MMSLILFGSCSWPGGSPASEPRYATFVGYAAVKVEPGKNGQTLLLLEKLQVQALVTRPVRKLIWLDAALKTFKEYSPPPGDSLVDFTIHPSGAVTTVEIVPAAGNDFFLKPLKARLTRFGSDGVEVGFTVESGLPPEVDGDPVLPFTLDRARIAASGEDVRLAVRWADNSVFAYGLTCGPGVLAVAWATEVEPPARLLSIGIIGGGFDNFHQGDRDAFVYLDTDASGTSYVVVPSNVEILPAHDAFFHETLTQGADPGHFDYGVSIITKISPQGGREHSVLSGLGTNKRLLNIRAGGGKLFLIGRIKTGNQPQDWNSWIQTFGDNGDPLSEFSIDVSQGDMFWDLAPLTSGSLLAVGSTGYTQNPVGLSVSDPRDHLAVIVGPDGTVERRFFLPLGPRGRGNETVSVKVAGDQAVFAGAINAPGTHAPVFSDAFVEIEPWTSGLDLGSP